MRAIVVSAAVIERDDAFLMTRRADDAHLGGRWEFPGGKVESGESREDALVREVDEELGCVARVGRLLLTTQHAYPDVHVELHFYAVVLDGAPQARLGQEMRWVARHELGALDLPEADADLVALLISTPSTP